MRYQRSLPRLLSLCLLVVTALMPLRAADEGEPAPQKSLPERTVIFAPAGLGPYRKVDDDATKSIPREMVGYAKRNKARFAVRLAETLPGGDDEIWQDIETARRMSSGAHYTIVTTIDSIETKRDMLLKSKKYKKESVFVQITVRAINPVEGESWVKTFKSKEPVKRSEPEGEALGYQKQAVQGAYAKAMNALLKWLNGKYDTENNRFPPPEPPVIEGKPLLDIKITSLPTGAKIYVDDVFRGTTPTTVPLSARTWTVKLERQGYQAWVKEVEVSPEMVIQPALEPIGKE